MKHLVIAADHRGFHQKNCIKNHLACRHAIECIDVGTMSDERTDYPIYAHKALDYLKTGKADAAILLCGSGAGMAIVANRVPHMYAAVAWNVQIAQMVKEDDNCNVLVIPSDFVADDQVCAVVDAWLGASFKGGVYADRLAMID
jgi:ribose 5-phosphate isomerase B